MAEKNPKTLTYTQEQNGSPYFSSMVGQCLWPSLPRKIAEKKLRQFERTSFIGSVLQMRLIRLFTIKTLVTFLKYIFELIFHADQPAFSVRH